MTQIGTGGGGFAVDTNAVRVAADGLAQCAQTVAAGRRCAQVAGLGEAENVAEAMRTFSAAWETALTQWQQSLSGYSAVVARAGATMAEAEQQRAATWSGMGGQVP
ncbi:hypothetical protein [Mobilicoccus caccae]|uniref:WXG100 family type VII secretion target n=1 Tax=Mobilicoccus caccae TaxID=1859295 RepID=A0ABQ6IVX1_9MICO|nr:hypothetical protein [Mobilicoccus caccae]GMA42099.1 hypothetical protein GCM10025883_41440 [Mobilicoccus caccae]